MAENILEMIEIIILTIGIRLLVIIAKNQVKKGRVLKSYFETLLKTLKDGE